MSKLLMFFLLLITFSPFAHAYLDPGTGSYLFQIIIATVVGGLFSVKIFWHKFIGLFHNLLGKKKHGE